MALGGGHESAHCSTLLMGSCIWKGGLCHSSSGGNHRHCGLANLLLFYFLSFQMGIALAAALQGEGGGPQGARPKDDTLDSEGEVTQRFWNAAIICLSLVFHLRRGKRREGPTLYLKKDMHGHQYSTRVGRWYFCHQCHFLFYSGNSALLLF